MALSRKTLALLLSAVAITPAAIFAVARGSDHADTPTIAKTPGADLTDVFIFPSPSNANNVVLVMNVHPLIPGGQSGGVSFDPSVLYQFKIDNTGDGVEDLVIQAKFSGTGPNQAATIYGPAKPVRTGTQTQLLPTPSATGTINNVFTGSNGAQVFAGAREDPFFFDLNQFFKILPDRATPLTGTNVPNPNAPQTTTFNGFPGTGTAAADFLAGYDLLSIVVELPKAQLIGAGTGKIGVWCTTSR